MLKKMKQLLLLFTLVLTFCVITPADSVCAGTNGHTQQDAVNWACARGNESWWGDIDGAYGCQCVDLILAYYDYLLGWHTYGNAKDYAWNDLPSGWTRVYSNPQPGDIVVWGSGAQMGWYPLATSYANNPYGHIGIVWRVNSSGSISTIETNVLGSQNAQYCERYPNNAACFIRPDFPTTPNYLNIGDDFTALIIKSDIWKPIHVRNDNVVLRGTEYGDASEHWYFDRQSDGTYVISSLADGRVLDVAGALTANGTNVQVYHRWGGNENTAQKWYVLGHETGNYRLVPQLATDKSLDVYNNDPYDGTNIHIWTRNSSSAQAFSIYKLTDKGPTSISIQGSSNITLMAGDKKQLAVNTGTATKWKTVTWSSENSTIASVSSTGVITGKTPGKVRIYARSNYNSSLNAYVTVTVTQKHTHKPTSKVVAASTQANGYIQQICTYCNQEISRTVIYRPTTIHLSATSYTYSGKSRKPSVTVTDANNQKIGSTYYNVTYSKGRKKVGTYSVTITFKGNYSGTITKTFTITPPETSIKKLSKSKKAFTVQWSKKSSQVSGYQIMYATTKNFSNAKTQTINSAKTASKKIRTGKAKKTYYVKIRTYKNTNGITYYSGWSKVKTVKTR